MSILTTITGFLVALIILVAVHEYGHFIVARLCGVKVLRYSIGFGGRLLSWTDKQGTEYALSAIPLGGYVKMLDEREMDVAEEERHLSFNAQHPWKKIAIAAAGPLANLLLAIVFFWVILFFTGKWDIAPIVGPLEEGSIAANAGLVEGQEIVAIDGEPTPSRIDVYMSLFKRLGESGDIEFTLKYDGSDLQYVSNARIHNWMRGEKDPDVLGGLGLKLKNPPIARKVIDVNPGSAAEAAGMKAGDEVISADGRHFVDGEEWTRYVRSMPGREMQMVVMREGEQTPIFLTPELKQADDGSEYGLAGVRLSYADDQVRLKEYGFFEAIPPAAKEMVDTVDMVFLSIKKLISKEISVNNLSGPIGIAKVAGDSAKAGIWVFFSFLATLSVYLGILNLLPVPVLDGGHIVFSLIEWLRGSPIPEKVQMWGVQAGMAMILCLVVVATFFDIFG